jgi:hypothetical protein
MDEIGAYLSNEAREPPDIRDSGEHRSKLQHGASTHRIFLCPAHACRQRQDVDLSVTAHLLDYRTVSAENNDRCYFAPVQVAHQI